MGTVEASRDYYSVGQLAAHLQSPVRAIESTATKLNITPALRLNGIVHFDGRQVQAITEAMRQQRGAR